MNNQTTNSTPQKPSSLPLIIILVVIITAVIVGGGVYLWQSSFAKTLLDKAKNNEQALRQQLDNLKTALTNLSEEKIQDVKSAIRDGEWKKINHGFYSFEVPANWQIDFYGRADGIGMSIWGIPVLKDENNKAVAELRCPMYETGYEGVDITSTVSRIITLENSRTYYQPSVSQQLFSSENHKVNYSKGVYGDKGYYHITFGPGTADQQYFLDRPNTCEIISLYLPASSELDNIYSRIYNSVMAYPLK